MCQGHESVACPVLSVIFLLRNIFMPSASFALYYSLEESRQSPRVYLRPDRHWSCALCRRCAVVFYIISQIPESFCLLYRQGTAIASPMENGDHERRIQLDFYRKLMMLVLQKVFSRVIAGEVRASLVYISLVDLPS